MKLLIVEDERRLSESIVDYLSREEYRCEQAFTFSEAIEKVGIYRYDCILLDLMLPGGGGLDVLRKVKERRPETGVIIVSAKDSLDDKVEGLRIGADDYLTKPFHLSELSMRIYALIRRRCSGGSNRLEVGPLSIDLDAHEATVDGGKLELTRSEYDLLLFFMENQGRVVSKGAIAEHLSGDMADMMDNFNFVYAHVKNLKTKLAEAGLHECIKTRYGMGYKWTLAEQA